MFGCIVPKDEEENAEEALNNENGETEVNNTENQE